jgi:hypothetical protein
MSNKIEHLKKNIAKLSVIVTSGHFPDFQSVETHGGSVWTTKLNEGQVVAHCGALIDHLKALQREIES